MKFLRRIPTRQLIALCASIVVIGSGITAIAIAATSGGPVPAPKPLAAAVHDALSAPKLQGVTARIDFTNHLIDSSSLQGSNPILQGASGRLWASNDGHLRLELQSSGGEGGNGDAQILVDRNQFKVYDSGSNTVYEGALPQGMSSHNGAQGSGERSGADNTTDKIPSLARIQQWITKLMEHANVLGPTPTDVAGQPTYTVRVSPKHDGGLLGGAELAWDSVTGAPLRVAVYASGDSSPVLELKATDISYGPVSASVFNVNPPSGAKVTNLSPASRHPSGAGPHGIGHRAASVVGLSAVQKQVPFKLTAPASIAGLPRGEVRLIKSGEKTGALATYGKGLGGIAVLEEPIVKPARDRSSGSPSGSGAEGSGQLQLPKVTINGVTGEELDTALGTLIRFQRGGVQYTILGSVPPAAAEAAARGL